MSDVEQGSGRLDDGAYLAVPASGAGPGVLVLHAWWGLTPFFQTLCDRLAAEGFVALAPDLYGDGVTVATVEEAEARIQGMDFEQAGQIASGALEQLRAHPATRGDGLGAVGFSMGAAWALVLSARYPDDIAAVTLFYGANPVDFGAARAAFQGHFAEEDPWEPMEGVREMEADMRAAGRDVTFHLYPGTGHWFFEDNRPDSFNAPAAALAWQRTLRFLGEQLA